MAPELKRELGLRDVTLFAIACMVGTRWIAAAAHAGPGSLALWLLTAVFFTIPLAVAVGSLAVAHPKAGGLYHWTRADFGPGTDSFAGGCIGSGWRCGSRARPCSTCRRRSRRWDCHRGVRACWARH